tara:strand:- start:143458 stop:143664 length:207 start_codon:yes stop_codon:yes gene_type:complete
MVSELAPVPSGGPFNKQQWDAHQEKTYQIGNDERTSPILDRLNGKPKKIPKANGIAGHCQYETHSGTP